MSPFIFPRIVFEGEGALEEFVDFLIQENYRKIFIVTDRTLVEIGLLDLLTEVLEGFEIFVFDEVEPEPSFETVEKAGAEARSFKPNVIIALGGGSVIDAAKGVWIKYENPPFELESISPFRRIGVGKKSILVSIPTTSGTGSEVTLGVVYTVEREGRRVKSALGSFELISNIVVLDTRFVKDLPKKLTLFTALDALSHAVEALVSTTANDLSDALSTKSILNVFEILPKLLENLDNIGLRRRMHLTAMMAGMAFSNSGLGFAHGIGHALGATFHIHHGRVVSMTLPYVVKYNYSDETAAHKYTKISEDLVSSGLAEEAPFHIQIYKFIEKVGGDTSLRKIISKEDFLREIEGVIELTMQDPDLIYNPVIPDRDAVKKILEDIYEGKL